MQSEMKKVSVTLFWVTLFSIAMGFLESAVVIYLRRIYYPGGFSFPLKPIDNDIAVVEIAREAATIIMLFAVGVLTGRNRAERFAWFIFSFAIWDIFYYVFLWVFLRWPDSLFAPDILFLIPVPWVGPVLAPVIVSLSFIMFALTTIFFSSKGKKVSFKPLETMLIMSGSLIGIISFTKDYLAAANVNQAKTTMIALANYVPGHFSWSLFWTGEGIILVAYVIYMRRIRKMIFDAPATK
jgi:hypothetical protein